MGGVPFISRGPGIAKFSRATDEPKYDAIYEGNCPTHGIPLERREDCGWCTTCGVGYALKSTGRREAELAVTFEFDTSKFDTTFE